MFSSALSKQPYYTQKKVKSHEQQSYMPDVVHSLLSLKLPAVEKYMPIIWDNKTYRVVNGDRKDYQNFTLRLTDEIHDDIPAYEVIIRKHMYGVSCRELPVLQACLYREGLGNYISWAITSSKTIAHYMKHKIGTQDKPNTGQLGVSFRRLPFKVLIDNNEQKMTCRIGQII